MSTDWSLTPESFEKFLARLSPDPEEAQQEYQQLRKKLFAFFRRNGCYEPDECFDKTIDIASKKIGTVESSVSASAYAHGVARKVLSEWHRKPQPDPLPPDVWILPKPADWDEGELACLEKCLDQLDAEDRDLITHYHRFEGQEKIKAHEKMAVEEGGANTLRIKVCRIRKKLRECVVRCLEASMER